MNKWFQWFQRPINLPVMAEFDKIRLERFKRMLTWMLTSVRGKMQKWRNTQKLF
jgi:hypothetical protein